MEGSINVSCCSMSFLFWNPERKCNDLYIFEPGPAALFSAMVLCSATKQARESRMCFVLASYLLFLLFLLFGWPILPLRARMAAARCSNMSGQTFSSVGISTVHHSLVTIPEAPQKRTPGFFAIDVTSSLVPRAAQICFFASQICFSAISAFESAVFCFFGLAF